MIYCKSTIIRFENKETKSFIDNTNVYFANMLERFHTHSLLFLSFKADINEGKD